jgi:SpoIID/LytB domain protein
MVDEDILLTHLGDDVGGRRRLDLCESTARAGHKARLLEIVAIHGVERPQPGEVERPGQAEDLRLAHIELVHEQLEHVRVDRTLDLEADGRPEAASRELSLEGRGFGHGAGMCQYGAEGMARKGANWRRILARYYPGADLAVAYGPK